MGGGDVDADLGHRSDGDGVDLLGGFRSCGEDLDAVSGEVLQPPGCHLGTSGVVDAHEQNRWARWLVPRHWISCAGLPVRTCAGSLWVGYR